ncbi:DUF3800 domain-containing protein [Anabaena sp. UHCC 0253]|uniref:DUF3800 domain-containing protein n=1 Tax=Anabaena sp. UHCC 0253 TaxID=2590019 RepID=UPI001447C1BA|nr:DUF3800 domain-containing protein [Anabaena sp. UHCC 0253]MTJ55663.1 DUF3800 domain-containing protein [Anabaena sp. UHCC 0253]
MYLFYIDESGTGSQDNNTNYFVFSSIAIHATDYKKSHEKIIQLKQNIIKEKKAEEWELKGNELCKGKAVFKNWQLEDRVRTFSSISETVNQLPFNIISIIVNKKILFENREEMRYDVNLYRFAFQNLLNHLDSFLKSSNESGILFLDSRSTHRSSIQDDRLVKDYIEWLNSLQYDCNFVEQPWFGTSKSYVGLQLADYVAYLISLKTQNIQESHRDFAFLKAFDILQEKIHLVEIPEN